MADRKKQAERAAAPTPASEWKQPNQQLGAITLPSGNTATIKQPELIELLAGGIIPDGLGGFVSEIIDAAGGGSMGQMFVKEPDKLGKMVAFMGAVCRAVFVEPRIAPEGEDPGEGEIALDWLTFEDKMAVFNHVMGGADNLLPFPGEAGPGAEPALDREDVPLPA
jgi:hypothetical protein